MFFADANNLPNCFKDFCNPFQEDELIVLHKNEVMTPENQWCFNNLLEIS